MNAVLKLGMLAIISILAGVICRIMIDQDQIIALADGVFLLEVGIPLLDLVIKLLFQLVHVLYSLLVLWLLLLGDERISTGHS